MRPSPGRGIQNGKNAIRLPAHRAFRFKGKRFERSLRGCNLSMFRDDFVTVVDGFDETFDGSWGREDSDILLHGFSTQAYASGFLWFMALPVPSFPR